MSDQLKDSAGSYFHNNYVSMRDGDEPLFSINGDLIRTRLNGYAIIPIEEYEKLSGDKEIDETLIHSMKLRLEGNKL